MAGAAQACKLLQMGASSEAGRATDSCPATALPCLRRRQSGSSTNIHSSSRLALTSTVVFSPFTTTRVTGEGAACSAQSGCRQWQRGTLTTTARANNKCQGSACRRQQRWV